LTLGREKLSFIGCDVVEVDADVVEDHDDGGVEDCGDEGSKIMVTARSKIVAMKGSKIMMTARSNIVTTQGSNFLRCRGLIS
jgi:hypothetical protein